MMMSYKKTIGTIAAMLLLSVFSTSAQEGGKEQGTGKGDATTKKWSHQFSLAGYAGPGSGAAALAWEHKYGIGTKGRLKIGYGVRATFFFAGKSDFLHSEADLLALSKVPYVVSKTQVNSLNAGIYTSYNFTPKFSAGFNIDAAGVSFGKKATGTFVGIPLSAKPTPFNLLLGGANDIGSLNSEFLLAYSFGNVGIKAGYSLMFTEYTMSVGDTRFRLISDMLMLGVNFKPF